MFLVDGPAHHFSQMESLILFQQALPITEWVKTSKVLPLAYLSQYTLSIKSKLSHQKNIMFFLHINLTNRDKVIGDEKVEGKINSASLEKTSLLQQLWTFHSSRILHTDALMPSTVK